MFHFKQILVAIDQLINALFFGWADETLSARAWRLRDKGWGTTRAVIDGFFFDPNHCMKSFMSECNRRQSPPEER